MTWTKWSRQPSTMTLALNLALVGCTGSSTQLWAETAIPIGQRPSLLALTYKPPNRGAPGDRGDGENAGSRPECPKVEKPLTALVPKYSLGLTVAEYPTFWFYIPYSSTLQHSAKFVLWDKRQNKVYQTTFQMTGTPGIVSIPIPETAPPLEIGEKYKWQFSLTCAARSDSAPVHGWVERVALPFPESQLQGATPRERAALYAENGLWFDSLTELAQQRRAQPQNAELEADWVNLLRAVDLQEQEIDSEPLVPCCDSSDTGSNAKK